MAIGYLSIQARTAHDAVPLEGVQITVLDGQGNAVYDLTTDESGQTQPVPLETLDKDFSQNPWFSEVPFTSYSVLAQAPGFNTLYISDIPIFDGETARLPVSLEPMPERQQAPTQEAISIGPPAIAFPETRRQEGLLDQSRVLRQVVIPNPITVHLGAPSSSAANVQVPFVDYIKNVASSEIYPTWPDAALRANIYAIITFALNRVYTEWYRSRGYSFDITNNTAYDQYYVKGRPIYDSISRIVDEIFNEYVRRQGQNAPYFTSFCNGTTATCPGMSQWGTVDLANQGRSALQILRSYYPNDIEIAETNIITSATTSYPGTALRVGSTGLDVEAIQTYLNRIRRNYPAIPAITDAAGSFQDSTRAAVTQFQRIFDLSPDGIVGKATWNKISTIYTAVTRLAELDSEGSSLGIGTVPPGSILRQGSRGQDVITLQYLLNMIAEFYPDIPALAQDGIFGSQTAQAVTAFQRARQLSPDGIVGPLTWQALYDTYYGIESNIPSQGPGQNTPPGQGTTPGQSTIRYVVKAGDSLWLIAQRYQTTVDAIKSLNGLTGDRLSIGQVLQIPVPQGGSFLTYTVKSGDTLWKLAQTYGTTVDAIKRANNLTSDMLSIGQVLRIPLN